METFSSPHRYVWPSELDLMARLAGLTLRERWADWGQQPFTSDSRSHISVWEKTALPSTRRRDRCEAGLRSGITSRTGPQEHEVDDR